MRRLSVVGYLFVIAAALFLRCGDLALRPLHNDEAINAFKLRELWEQGTFRYDPHEYHGPALYYLAVPVLKAAALTTGDAQPTDAALRAVAVVIGMGLVLVLAGLWRTWGWGPVFLGGLFTATSPVVVYYSRYFIHEMLLVLAGALAWIAWLREGPGSPGSGTGPGVEEGPVPARTTTWRWTVVSGVGLGLMWATKETFVFMLAAAVGAWMGVAFLEGGVRGIRERWKALPWRRLGVAAVVAFGVGALLFSSFLAHPAGIVDSVRTYLIWGERAGGASPHVHPWTFFGERLFWYRWRGGPLWTEAFVGVLAVVGAASALRGGAGWTATGRRAGRFLVFYVVLLGGVYSVIRYKTPWCALGFHLPVLLLAGCGGWELARWAASRVRVVGPVVVAASLAVGTGHLAWQAWRASREWGADFRNPWVYGHTSADVFELLEQVRAVTASTAEGKALPLWVVAPESNYWPLPWYFRDRTNVGWWDALPAGPLPPVVIAATKMGLGLEEKTGQGWTQAGMFELRPRYFVEVYVEAGRWKHFLAARAEERKRSSP